MDPNEALRRLREYASEVISAYDDIEPDDPRSNQLALAESFLDLDEWLTKGGFVPDGWQPQRPAGDLTNPMRVRACRWCGVAVYLRARSDAPMVGGTGPARNEHWRHVHGNARHCVGGNGTVAEPYDGSGPLAEELRALGE